MSGKGKSKLGVQFAQAQTSPGGTKQYNIGLNVIENEDPDQRARLAE